MRNHRDQIIKEFTKFRIGMEKQSSQYSFLVTYESGKLSAVETWRNKIGQSVGQERWVWEITGDELTLTFNTYAPGIEVLPFKRV